MSYCIIKYFTLEQLISSSLAGLNIIAASETEYFIDCYLMQNKIWLWKFTFSHFSKMRQQVFKKLTPLLSWLPSTSSSNVLVSCLSVSTGAGGLLVSWPLLVLSHPCGTHSILHAYLCVLSASASLSAHQEGSCDCVADKLVGREMEKKRTRSNTSNLLAVTPLVQSEVRNQCKWAACVWPVCCQRAALWFPQPSVLIVPRARLCDT